MLADLIHDCKVALAFLTRLPVAPEPIAAGSSLGASVVMFPVVGALIGLLGGGGYALAFWLGLPPLPAATAALATTIWLTGALHEDGLADVADGFGGGRTLEDKLRIMRELTNRQLWGARAGPGSAGTRRRARRPGRPGRSRSGPGGGRGHVPRRLGPRHDDAAPDP